MKFCGLPICPIFFMSKSPGVFDMKNVVRPKALSIRIVEN